MKGRAALSGALPISRMPIVENQGRARLPGAMGNTEAAPDDPDFPTTLTDLFKDAEWRRDLPAVLTTTRGAVRAQSYAEIIALARRLAARLAAARVRPGDRVVVMAANSPEWLVATIATVLAGAVIVPLDSQLHGDMLAHVLRDCDPALVFADARGERALRGAPARRAPLFRLDIPAGSRQSWHALLGDDPDALPTAAPDDTAVLFYTSGTTGPPKGVPLTHANLCFQVRALLAIRLADPQDRCLVALPFHHVYPFVAGLLASFGYGMSVVIPGAIQGPQILAALRDCRATIVIGVPRLYEILIESIRNRVRASGRLAAAAFDALLRLSVFLGVRAGLRVGRWLFAPLHRRLAPDLRMIVSGGATLAADTAWAMEGLGWSVAAGYGLTETAPIIGFLLPGERRFDTVGKPVPGIELRLSRPDDSGVGEIQVRGPGVFAGYRNLADRTAAAFTRDGWFRTDDLGFVDAHGFLHVVGRASTLIVTASGENVQPETVEEAYERHPLIKEIGVLDGGEGLAAVVVPTTGDEAAIRDAIVESSRTLPSYWRLTDVQLSREALARTRLGKIRRSALRTRYEALKAGRGVLPAGPMTPDEMSDADRELLEAPAAAAVWDWLARRYPNRALTPDSSPAADLGIDSLEWMAMAIELQRIAGVALTEQATARIATVRDLLGEIVNAAGGGEPLPTGLPDDPRALLDDRQKRFLVPLGPAARACAWLLQAFIRACAHVYFRFEVAGRENLPDEGAFLIAPNHASVLDPFALTAALGSHAVRRTFWAAWTGMAFANPLFRIVSRLAQALPIEIDRAAFSSLALGLAALRDGRNLVWFPEGGRSPTGRLTPFKVGTGLLLEKARVPVVPVLIEGTFDAMPIGRRFPRPCKVRVTFAPPVATEELERRGHGETAAERITTGLQETAARMQENEPQVR